MSFTFSKNDLSDFSGFGIKLSSLIFFFFNFFCSLFSVFGVQTLTCTNKSPVPYPLILLIPLPLSLRILPDCIHSSSLILTFPFIASMSLEIPRTASAKLMYKS